MGRLVAAQFPAWAHLAVEPVAEDGWDNRTYRLGEDMTVRLPTHQRYVPAVAKEDRWLRVLAPQLPVAIPVPVGLGVPGEGYPFPWSIRRWLDGEPARADRIADLADFGVKVARLLVALQRIDATGGPAAGEHSFHRGESPRCYDDETRRCLAALEGRIDTAGAAAVWDAALRSHWPGPPVWFHGDVAAGNLLVRDGRLAAVIDFGTCGVGDPACDLVIAWTMFSGDSRAAFRRILDADPGMWARARGWAVWKSLLGLATDVDANDTASAANRRVIEEVLADHARFAADAVNGGGTVPA